MKPLALALALALPSSWLAAQAGAAPFSGDYALNPEKVAEGVYVFIGVLENFSRENGGNIVNTGCIIGPEGVIVIDTGPAKRYGDQQRAAIARLTDKPIVQVYLTHAHPDHFFGNQAYAAVPIAALPGTSAAISANAGALLDNLYRLTGAWMKGTETLAPNRAAASGRVSIAGRALTLIALRGHTAADLAILDEASGTLFAGDVAFNQRAATTPDANVRDWFMSLETLEKLKIRALVPGHGPVGHDAGAILQTKDYLGWLEAALHDAANRGLDMPEVMELPVPKRFAALAVIGPEFARSVTHLYPSIELATLPVLPDAHRNGVN